MKRTVIAVADIVAVTAGLSGCNSSGQKTGGQKAGGDSGKGLTVGLIIPQGDKYFEGIQAGVKAAAKADGGTVITSNSNNDAGQESQAIQNLIQRQVDAILIQPASSGAGSLASMKLATSANIPVICYGNCTGEAANPNLVKGAVQSDNTSLGSSTGKMAAEYIKTHLKGSATIGILNCDSFDVCTQRKAGFKQALADAGVKAKYAADQEAFLADKAKPVATNILSAHPDINLFFAANEGGTIGEVSAVSATSKALPVFGIDMTPQLGKMLLDSNNILQATTGQDATQTATSA